ncbi:hypothetical protein PQ455_07760 [Sphingomonas naphthae]|uniref:Type II secretion system protein GspF domain-containing protein n=1 Tax=Sphingomonas naphthae TaxID=1813468 RepID=A0ABY7TTA1_9SPHN|nr:hypothetical protein [Sphingomonas naphthae]WCT75099.1 hypothetical protein PQ455_07760 [Sphingomonas naphthae]
MSLAPAPARRFGDPAPAARPRPVLVAAEATPALSRIERKVILLSRLDPAPRGPVMAGLARAAHWLFGIEPATDLADPKLEALRRFAILIRIGRGQASEAETARFRAAGYDPMLAETIHALCGVRNPVRAYKLRRNRHAALKLAALGLAMVPVTMLTGARLDSELIGIVAAAVLFVILAPLACLTLE